MKIIGRCRLIGLVVAMVMLTPAMAQKATEQYIPIGKSPGASQKYSYIGTIVAVDSETHVITVENEAGRHDLRVAKETLIWLDRTKRKRRNSMGTFADCEVGRSVEVMHLLDDSRTAAWVKIESR